jgi:hypothetical protein
MQDGLDLAHHGQYMKPSTEGARELDGGDQQLVAGGFVIEVNGDQNSFVHQRANQQRSLEHQLIPETREQQAGRVGPFN